VVPDVEELVSGPPVDVAVANARLKVEAVLRAGPVDVQGASAAALTEASLHAPPARSAFVVLGVDTVVVVGETIYGKPRSALEARDMLAMLSGREHLVVSGLCVAERGEVRATSATTRVRFRELSPATLDWYVATGEWEERAGGYAIQGRGAALVAEIAGDYLNVVGLPVAALLELLPGILHGAA
jgi:septum formation protein